MLDRNPNYKSQEESANGGALFQNCHDTTISGLHVTEVRHLQAGLMLENCRRINVTGCTILDCDNAGVLLKGVADSRISGCLISNDTSTRQPWTAMKVEGGGDTVFDKD